MGAFDLLSPLDLEHFTRLVLETETGQSWRTYKVGADGGIDLRTVTAKNSVASIAQCKHYPNASGARLVKAAEHEAERAPALGVMEGYWFITTAGITPETEDRIKAALEPIDCRELHVIDRDILVAWMNDNPQKVLGFPKLWLTNSVAVSNISAPATWARSRFLHADLEKEVKYLVPTSTLARAEARLAESRVVCLVGPPGVGKTSLAKMLVARRVAEGATPIEVSSGADEAFSLISTVEHPVFYMDDFLGATYLEELIPRNEDHRLARLIEKITESESAWLVMTSRTNILEQGVSKHEKLALSRIRDLTVDVEDRDLNKRERAAILFQLVSQLAGSSLAAASLLVADHLEEILDHSNFNPRVLWFATQEARRPPGSATDFASSVLQLLDHPERLWEAAFENTLTDDGRDLVLTIASASAPLTAAEALDTGLMSGWTGSPAVRERRFAKALRDCFGTFVIESSDYYRKNRPWAGTQTLYTLRSPSLQDFAKLHAAARAGTIRQLIAGASALRDLDWVCFSLWPSVPNGIALSLQNALSERLTELYLDVRTAMPSRAVAEHAHVVAMVRATGAPLAVKSLPLPEADDIAESDDSDLGSLAQGLRLTATTLDEEQLAMRLSRTSLDEFDDAFKLIAQLGFDCGPDSMCGSVLEEAFSEHMRTFMEEHDPESLHSYTADELDGAAAIMEDHGIYLPDFSSEAVWDHFHEVTYEPDYDEERVRSAHLGLQHERPGPAFADIDSRALFGSLVELDD